MWVYRIQRHGVLKCRVGSWRNRELDVWWWSFAWGDLWKLRLRIVVWNEHLLTIYVEHL